MNTYCGCGTTRNKLSWITFGIFLVLGFILVSIGVRKYDKCVTDGQDSFYYQDNANDDEIYNSCGEKYGAFVWIAILSWILCSIPLYVMCCCTKKPDRLQPVIGVVAQNNINNNSINYNNNNEFPAIYVATAAPLYSQQQQQQQQFQYQLQQQQGNNLYNQTVPGYPQYGNVQNINNSLQMDLENQQYPQQDINNVAK